jgi:hypothetical protein
MATGFPGSALPPQQIQTCQQNLGNPTPQALALIHDNLLNAYNDLYTIDGQVTNGPVLPAPILQQGQTDDLALQCMDVAVNPAISFGDDVTVTVHGTHQPGSAMGSARGASTLATRIFQLRIVVASNAAPGQRSITVTNPGQTSSVPAPAFLTIVPANWSAVS